jgi:RimJ/RimL family protein N-acetyltransferase
MTNTTRATYIYRMDCNDLIRAPRELRTAQCVLKASSAEFVDTRVAWAKASTDMLTFTSNWRRSIDPERALKSLQSEIVAVERGDELIFNVFELATDAHVGRIDLHSWDFDAPRCEIGYMADARTCGRGLLREAALACVELAFSMGVRRVQALCDVRNERSIRFAKALGMQEEGVLRNYGRDHDNALYDEAVLAIIRRG